MLGTVPLGVPLGVGSPLPLAVHLPLACPSATPLPPMWCCRCGALLEDTDTTPCATWAMVTVRAASGPWGGEGEGEGKGPREQGLRGIGWLESALVAESAK